MSFVSPTSTESMFIMSRMFGYRTTTTGLFRRISQARANYFIGHMRPSGLQLPPKRIAACYTDKPQRVAESRLVGDSFEFRADCAASDRSISCPIRNQAPSHGRDLADRLFRVLLD